MEDVTTSEKTYSLTFHGKGGAFFGIIIINWLLTVLTLGFYYPWAKAKTLQYLYGETALHNDRFAFHGTGKEMFKGFIKALLIIAALAIISGVFVVLEMPIVGTLLFYLGLIAIAPIAIHGSYRYRMSRTSWRGIRFGYRGDRNEFVKNFFLWLFYTIISIGIYGAWMTVNLRKYVLGHVRFGDISFKYEAEGFDFFILNLKGYFLTVITLGIYMFWWQRDIFAFYIDNLSLEKDDESIRLRSTATGGDFFKLIIVNLLILIFTLGFGYAWVVVRAMEFVTSKIEMTGNIDLDKITQTEDNYNNATGEDLTDILDLDFVI